MALDLLGLLARRQGDHDDAVTAYEEALGVVRDLGLRDETPFLLVDLAGLQVLIGDFEAAAIFHKQALDLAKEFGTRDALALVRTGLAEAACREGDYAGAAELHQAALSFYREAGMAGDAARSLAA